MEGSQGSACVMNVSVDQFTQSDAIIHFRGKGAITSMRCA